MKRTMIVLAAAAALAVSAVVIGGVPDRAPAPALAATPLGSVCHAGAVLPLFSSAEFNTHLIGHGDAMIKNASAQAECLNPTAAPPGTEGVGYAMCHNHQVIWVATAQEFFDHSNKHGDVWLHSPGQGCVLP